MPDTIDAVLQAWQAALRLQPGEPDETTSDRLLFTGNIQDSVPRKLVLDPQLSPRDKLAWQILRLYAISQNGAAFPSYRVLQKLLAGCPATESASRSTVSHCLIMLRLTRWLSLCQRNRDPLTGRILCNIYLLHDDPIASQDAQRLDSRYLQLLSDCTRHANKSLRLAAQMIWRLLHDDPTQHDLLSQFAHTEVIPQNPRLTTESCDSTRSAPGTVTGLSDHTPGLKSKIATNSSSWPLVLNKDSAHVLNTVKRKISSTQIQWPESLSLTSAQRGAVWQAMSELPDRLCQEVLDNCNHRIAAGGVSNPLGYILATLRKAKRGEFNLFKRQKPNRQRRTAVESGGQGSTLAENLRYLCQNTKKRRQP